MMEDLYEKFLPQFVEQARARIARATATLAQPDPSAMTVVVREIHSIAGEAGLLGQGGIMALARQGEELAKRVRDAGAAPAEGDLQALAGALRELEQALDQIGAKSKPQP